MTLIRLSPDPNPDPELNPYPNPDPNPDLNPDPGPYPNPIPDPNPGHNPDPIPYTKPGPNPDSPPNPDPYPDPILALTPTLILTLNLILDFQFSLPRPLPLHYYTCSICSLVGIRSQYTGRPAGEVIPFRISTEPSQIARPLYRLPLCYMNTHVRDHRVDSVNSGRVLGVNRYAGGAEVARQPPMPVRMPRAPVGIDGPLQVGYPGYTSRNYGTYDLVFEFFFVLFVRVIYRKIVLMYCTWYYFVPLCPEF